MCLSPSFISAKLTTNLVPPVLHPPQLFEANPLNPIMALFNLRPRKYFKGLKSVAFLTNGIFLIFGFNGETGGCMLPCRVLLFFPRCEKVKSEAIDPLSLRNFLGISLLQATPGTWKMKHIPFVLLMPILYVSFFQAEVMTAHLLCMRCLRLS